MKRKRLNLAAAFSLVALTIAACGGGGTTATTTSVAAGATTKPAPTTVATTSPAPATTRPANTTTAASMDGVEITISAVDSEGFSTDIIEVTAGQEVTIIFDNKDSGGEPHNLHVKTDIADFLTPITQGPDVNEMTFTIDTPGEYEFFCDTHTTQMKGTLIVKPS